MRSCLLRGDGESDDEARAGGAVRRELERPAVLPDDALRDGAPHAGAVVAGLRGEERLEDALADRVGDARAVVLAGDLDETILPARPDGPAPVRRRRRRRLARVDEEVDDHLLDPAGV